MSSACTLAHSILSPLCSKQLKFYRSNWNDNSNDMKVNSEQHLPIEMLLIESLWMMGMHLTRGRDRGRPRIFCYVKILLSKMLAHLRSLRGRVVTSHPTGWEVTSEIPIRGMWVISVLTYSYPQWSVLWVLMGRLVPHS